ncbi:hypothetical protein DXG03_007821 [Asterophora parasitica]|uniref:Uncharacterized protein n=1 Tax=Asterophora parasitica TaxID=117018 RepID=A0A9P7GC89_9AGAR|nr:hypothetical protein DXG03_007821 [Asterophora parasitica]
MKDVARRQDIFARPPPPPPSQTERWSDEEIIRLVDETPCLPGTDNMLVLIAPDTAVKRCWKFDATVAEQLSMQLVYSHTRIPLPRAHRVIQHVHGRGDAYLVMDYIPKYQRLQTAWKGMSMWAKLRVIVALRVYLRQLRRVQHPPSMGKPGPPGPKPLRCSGLQFYECIKGPFPTSEALADTIVKVTDEH